MARKIEVLPKIKLGIRFWTEYVVGRFFRFLLVKFRCLICYLLYSVERLATLLIRVNC